MVQRINHKNRTCKVSVETGIAAFLAAFAFLAASAKVSELRPLPAATRPSTEISTNILFKAAGATVRRYDISLSFVGTESNCVEVAFGRDADGDGALSLDETGAAFGWRCGAMFAEGGDCRFTEPSVATNPAPRDMVLKITSGFELTPKSVEFSCGGVPVLTEVFAEPPEWAFDPSWDTLRMTRRGVAAGESGIADTGPRPLILTVR